MNPDALIVEWLDVTGSSPRVAAFRDAFADAVQDARAVIRLAEVDSRAEHVDLLFAGFVADAFPQVVALKLVQHRLEGWHSTIGEVVLLCYGHVEPMPSEEDVRNLVTDQMLHIAPQVDTLRPGTPDALREWCLNKMIRKARERKIGLDPEQTAGTDASAWTD